MNELNSLHNVNENRVQTGLYSALFVRQPSKGEKKYYLFMPGTTTPFFGGTPDTVEYSILQNGGKGKVFGKMSYDDKESDFMLHRDNVIRIESFVGQQLDFLSVTADGLGYKGTGMVEYKPNDGTEDDPHTGTYTVAVSFADKKAIIDVRPLIQDTVLFANAIPESLNIGTDGQTVNIESYDEGYNIDVKILDNDGKEVPAFAKTITQPTSGSKEGSVKFTASGTGDNYACAYITISKEDFASWTTTILLESHNTTATQSAPTGYSASSANYASRQ